MSQITERRLREIEDYTKRPGVKMTPEFLYIRELVGEVRRLKKEMEQAAVIKTDVPVTFGKADDLLDRDK
jgi:hypothetical protein